MISVSLRDIFAALFREAYLAYSLTLIVLSFALGFALAKAWMRKVEKELKAKEESLKEQEAYFNTLKSENSSLKEELEKIKLNPGYWINELPDTPFKPSEVKKTDIEKI